MKNGKSEKMARMADKAGDNAVFYAAAERRIEYFTVAIGAAGAICAAIFWRASAGAGVAIGTLLSWLNFRWIRHGVGVLARLSMAQEGAEKPRVPRLTYVKMIGRYALLIAAAYVILRGLHSMREGFLCGLFAAVAAVVVELVGQLIRTGRARLAAPQ
jgi:ATP synthase I chain